MTVRRSAGLIGLLELHSSQGGFWFPHAYFDSRRRCLHVVDDYPQFVLTRGQLIRDFEIEDCTDRLGRPQTRGKKIFIGFPQDMIRLKDPVVIIVVQA